MSRAAVIGALAAVLSLACGEVFAQEAAREAPLGLTWGVSSNEVRALGAELKDTPEKEYGVSYVATNLPRALSDQEVAFLSFGYDEKLWRIVLVSRAYSNDPSGISIRERYNELSGVLSEKYGKGTPFHQLSSSSFYKESRHFLSGIEGGHSFWYTDFQTPSVLVRLGISSSDSSTGRWRIIFENKELKRAFEISRRGREKSAL